MGIVEDSLWHDDIEEQAVLGGSWVWRSGSSTACYILLKLLLGFGVVERGDIPRENGDHERPGDEGPIRGGLWTDSAHTATFDLPVSACGSDRCSEAEVSHGRLGISDVCEIICLTRLLDVLVWRQGRNQSVIFTLKLMAWWTS